MRQLDGELVPATFGGEPQVGSPVEDDDMPDFEATAEEIAGVATAYPAGDTESR